MPRMSKDQLRSNEFRLRATNILKEPNWLEEDVRRWLEKELKREKDYIYTENEHAALARIIAASTLFDEWDGYTVDELLTAAYHYRADGSYEDEVVLDDLRAQNAKKLRLREMGHLVGFCRNIAGLPVARFKPEVEKYDNLE